MRPMWLASYKPCVGVGWMNLIMLDCQSAYSSDPNCVLYSRLAIPTSKAPTIRSKPRPQSNAPTFATYAVRLVITRVPHGTAKRPCSCLLPLIWLWVKNILWLSGVPWMLRSSTTQVHLSLSSLIPHPTEILALPPVEVIIEVCWPRPM